MLSRSEFYSRIWANQGGTGSAFRWIETIWQGDQEALCRAACPATILDAANYRLHPGLIEAACQVLHCCATIETEEQLRQNSTTFVPFSLDVLSLYGVKATYEQAWCYAQLREYNENNVLADLSIMNNSGELVAQLEGFRLRPITQQGLAASLQRVAIHADGKLIPDSLPGPMDGIDKAALTLQQVVNYLQAQCAELSGYPETAIFRDRGFMAMGLDSLVAMILSNRIRQNFGCAVSATQILLSVSIESLAQIICARGSETGL
jgi:aryl carrier-like protein